MKTIFYNGDFITLESNKADAILIENGIIKKVGTIEEIFNYKDSNTEIHDLEGKTMMPAFMDAHSHFSGVANNLLKVDLEDCENFDEIKSKLITFKKENNILDGEWIIACNYDHNKLQEKTHPKKEIIDSVLPNNPVLLQHKSGHSGVINSKGLEYLKIDENTKEINGGMIEKIDGKLTGYLEENAFIELQLKIPMPSIQNLIDAYRNAQEIYLKNGITTLQDGMIYKEMIPIYKKLIEDRILKIDLVSYIKINEKEKFMESFKEYFDQYKDNLKIGGYKIFLDGSPQARTAWMRTPYLDDTNYFGYGTMNENQLEKAVKTAYEDNMQILAHCNGDKAAEQYIDAIKSNKNNNDIRPVMIHAQLLGKDQIADLKKTGIIPSFFINHIYHLGDTHIKNFGFDRAKEICPVGTALKQGVIYTFHQDSPVISPNMFESIWCAVKRVTKNGVALDEKEKISVLDAIKGVTINVAYQYFEEDKKGSIKEGKNADLIIIDKNPLKVKIDEIRDIKVLATFKDGKIVYKD